MEKKQTALDYFVKKLEVMKVNNLSEFYNEIEIAKQMEKEQHEETWAAAWNESAKSGHFEQYFNETFGGNNE